MQIKIRSFRAIERADIEVDDITIVAGRNEAGKSSLCEAIDAALRGDPVTIEGVLKKTAHLLVHDGAEKGMVGIATEGGSTKITYPTCEVETEGANPPHASPFATGALFIPLMTPKDRASALAPYLQATPSQEALASELADAGVSENLIGRVWASIVERGWDKAHAQAKEQGAKLKGKWEALTGQSYGPVKAKQWEPEGWEDVAGEDPDALEQGVANATAALEGLIARSAVDAAALETLRSQAAKLETAEENIDTFRDEEAAASAELVEAQKELDALPSAHSGNTLPCPHCGEPLFLNRINPGELHIEKAEAPPPAEELAERRKKRREIEDRVRELDRQVQNARHGLADAIEAQDAAQAAQARLDKVDDEAPTEDALAEARAETFNAKEAADRAAALLAKNQAIVAALAPDGLRKRVLAKAIAAFNKDYLAPLCEAAKWPAVTLGGDIGVYYGGRPFNLVSTSAKYRARVVLQLALARFNDDPLVLIDAADILDGPNRNGLLKLLRHVGIPAVLGVTYGSPKTVPDLAEKGLGRSYWIEDGVVAPLDQAAVKEAA